MDDISVIFEKLIHPEDEYIVVHNALINIGEYDNSFKYSIISLVKEYVGKGHTFLFPSFTFSFTHSGVYDKFKTKSETGIMAEWISCIPESIRTKHPIYSFVVIGRNVKVIEKCKSASTFSDDSPFGLLHKKNAKIMMLGASWNDCTQFHYYEEKNKVPYRFYKNFKGLSVNEVGLLKVNCKMYVRNLELEIENDFSSLISDIESHENYQSYKYKRSSISTINAKAIGELANKKISENEYALTNYNKINCSYNIALFNSRTSSLVFDEFNKNLKKYIVNCKFDIIENKYGQVETQILDEASDVNNTSLLASFFTDRLEDVLSVDTLDEVSSGNISLYEKRIDTYVELILEHRKRKSSIIFVNMFSESKLRSLSNGLYDNGCLNNLNSYMYEKLKDETNIYLIDVNSMPISSWSQSSNDNRLWTVGRIPFSKSFSQEITYLYTKYLISLLGKSIRLIILDLDGTLWGGVLGEDGFDNVDLGGDYPGNVYKYFQKSIKYLSERGIALAIVSKNNEGDALEFIDNHPDMVLKKSDFAAWRINWEEKYINVIDIVNEVGVSIENTCFIDDNPVEREKMKANISGLKIIDLPEDPALYESTLLGNPYLGFLDVLNEDKKRNKNYINKRKYSAEKNKYKNADDFFSSINPSLNISYLNESNLKRVEQLIMKTNQFNTTGLRLTGSEVLSLQKNKHSIYVLGYSDDLQDKENIGVCIVKEGGNIASIELLLLSCRVLQRGLETGFLSWLVDNYQKKGFERIDGRILSLPRNQPVRDIYKNHGFKFNNNEHWRMPLANKIISVPAYLEIIEGN